MAPLEELAATPPCDPTLPELELDRPELPDPVELLAEVDPVPELLDVVVSVPLVPVQPAKQRRPIRVRVRMSGS